MDPRTNYGAPYRVDHGSLKTKHRNHSHSQVYLYTFIAFCGFTNPVEAEATPRSDWITLLYSFISHLQAEDRPCRRVVATFMNALMRRLGYATTRPSELKQLNIRREIDQIIVVADVTKQEAAMATELVRMIPPQNKSYCTTGRLIKLTELVLPAIIRSKRMTAAIGILDLTIKERAALARQYKWERWVLHAIACIQKQYDKSGYWRITRKYAESEFWDRHPLLKTFILTGRILHREQPPAEDIQVITVDILPSVSRRRRLAAMKGRRNVDRAERALDRETSRLLLWLYKLKSSEGFAVEAPLQQVIRGKAREELTLRIFYCFCARLCGIFNRFSKLRGHKEDTHKKQCPTDGLLGTVYNWKEAGVFAPAVDPCHKIDYTEVMLMLSDLALQQPDLYREEPEHLPMIPIFDINEQHIQQLSSVARTPRERLYISTSKTTGLRIQAVSDMRISHIWDPNLNAARESTIVIEKGSKERRICFSAETQSAIADYMNEHRQVSQDQHVFTHGPVCPKFIIDGILRSLCRRAGIQPFNHHRWRKFLCTSLVTKGVPIDVVAKWIGHGGSVTTHNSYLSEFEIQHKVQHLMQQCNNEVHPTDIQDTTSGITGNEKMWDKLEDMVVQRDMLRDEINHLRLKMMQLEDQAGCDTSKRQTNGTTSSSSISDKEKLFW